MCDEEVAALVQYAERLDELGLLAARQAEDLSAIERNVQAGVSRAEISAQILQVLADVTAIARHASTLATGVKMIAGVGTASS